MTSLAANPRGVQKSSFVHSDRVGPCKKGRHSGPLPDATHLFPLRSVLSTLPLLLNGVLMYCDLTA